MQGKFYPNQRDPVPKHNNNKPSIMQNMKNDYCQYFVDTNQRPQNFIRDIKKSERFKDYPKLNELLQFKDDLLKKRNHPPMFIKANLKELDFNSLGKYDVILVDPPWEEYKTRIAGLPVYSMHEKLEGWSFEEIANLKMDLLANPCSFIFLWVGSEHLDYGRQLLKIWGYKRCEDIVWLKTNKSCFTNQESIMSAKVPVNKDKHYLVNVKEHCLVGVKGDVKRASDSHFIHANIDTDVIVAEEPDLGSPEKPSEIYEIIERFCLGRKRIELFGDNNGIRNGW